MAAVLETVESLLSFLEQASAVMGDQVYAEAKAQQLGRLRSQILSTRDLGVGDGGQCDRSASPEQSSCTLRGRGDREHASQSHTGSHSKLAWQARPDPRLPKLCSFRDSGCLAELA